MANSSCIIFLVTFLVLALVGVHSEIPCRLFIARDGLFQTNLRGGSERFVCKLDPQCLMANHTVIGPFWRFNDKWLRGFKSYLKNVTNTLTIVKISSEDFGTYECWIKINDLKFKAAVKLIEPVTKDYTLRILSDSYGDL